MDNLIWTGELLISDGAHSVGLCCQIEHTHACPLKMLGADFGAKHGRVLATKKWCLIPVVEAGNQCRAGWNGTAFFVMVSG